MLRHLNNIVRALLIHACLPPVFWVEALHTATSYTTSYLLNVSTILHPHLPFINDTPLKITFVRSGAHATRTPLLPNHTNLIPGLFVAYFWATLPTSGATIVYIQQLVGSTSPAKSFLTKTPSHLPAPHLRLRITSWMMTRLSLPTSQSSISPTHHHSPVPNTTLNQRPKPLILPQPLPNTNLPLPLRPTTPYGRNTHLPSTRSSEHPPYANSSQNWYHQTKSEI
ncbi:hypothetical protein HanIR_Chr12g0584351 [Helianthus annuus]|nr:hypothetical protein HanIR_Chr12g0584351 [Helianthus annuus]